jgi:hypothetical protein
MKQETCWSEYQWGWFAETEMDTGMGFAKESILDDSIGVLRAEVEIHPK